MKALDVEIPVGVAKVDARGHVTRTDEEKARLVAEVNRLMKDEGYALTAACKQLGLTQSHYENWSTPPGRPLWELSSAEKADLLIRAREMYMKGLRVDEIATTLGLNVSSIRGWITTGNWSGGKPGPKVKKTKALKSKSKSLTKSLALEGKTKEPGPITISIPENLTKTGDDHGSEDDAPFVMLIGRRNDINRALENLGALFSKR